MSVGLVGLDPISCPLVNPSPSQSPDKKPLENGKVTCAGTESQALFGLVPSITSWPLVAPSPSQSFEANSKQLPTTIVIVAVAQLLRFNLSQMVYARVYVPAGIPAGTDTLPLAAIVAPVMPPLEVNVIWTAVAAKTFPLMVSFVITLPAIPPVTPFTFELLKLSLTALITNDVVNIGGAGSTKICKVAFAQFAGVALSQTWYTIATGPEKPGAGVKLYVPFGFIVKVPCADVGPLTTLALKLALALVLMSLASTLPLTLLVPLAFATTLA